MSRQAKAAPRAKRRRWGWGSGRGAAARRGVAVASTIAVVVVGASLAAGRASGSAPPTADEIVARNVAARGGLDAWRKVQTMVWIGHIQSDHAPVPVMQFELDQKRPNKTRLQIDALGDRSMRVFDGARGWKLRAVRGRPEVQPYTPEELRYAQVGPGIDGPLIDSAAKGSAVALQGLDEIGGRKAYHLAVHPAQGGTEDVWVDAQTYLDVRLDRTAEGPAGAQRRVSASYRDYRTVEGLQIPFLIETGGGPGATPDRMQIDTVVLNTPLGDPEFENPAASLLRRRAWPGGVPRARAPAAPPIAPTAARSARGSAQP